MTTLSLSTAAAHLAELLKVRVEQVQATLELLEAGNTLPFIARYRKEVTGGLDDEQLWNLEREWKSYRTTEERRAAILAGLESQGKLTDVLRQAIARAATKAELEEIYAPFKAKRVTRASQARARGLEPLARRILSQERTRADLAQIVKPFLGPEVPDGEAALAGARDIVAEMISEHPEVRLRLRDKGWLWGVVTAQKVNKAEDPKQTFKAYYEFRCSPNRLKAHQILALNRGEQEKVLRVRLELPERDWQEVVFSEFPVDRSSIWADSLRQAGQDAAERLLLPAVEREVRRRLTDLAAAQALDSFRTNLRNLLLSPPLPGSSVLGLDPGFRTGCKVAVVDPTGQVLETTTIYPHGSESERKRARATLVALVERHGVTLVALGNGTASAETEMLLAEVVEQMPHLRYLIVSEAGASVYSASPLARQELPDLDVSLRGAVSIARRVQDPLAELVKIDPRSIGVGMYQHDQDQTQLSEALRSVVESVVNQVGVDLNTASPALLSYVAGIGPKLAEKIVEHRNRRGPFRKRQDLLEVAGLGPRTFEQAAGFLRIRQGLEPLDGSSIHPESYAVARSILGLANLKSEDSPERRRGGLAALQAKTSNPTLAHQLKIGLPTLVDILEQLVAPGRDPRSELPRPLMRGRPLTLEELKVGQELDGTVRNVVEFGAFVDIGVKQDGLLHRSQIPRGRELAVGQVVQVRIQQVEAERGRISLAWAGR